LIEEVKRGQVHTSNLDIFNLEETDLQPSANMANQMDLHKAGQAIIRLQSVYQIPLQQLSSGSIYGQSSASNLSAEDCVFLGKHAFNLDMVVASVYWFFEGLRLAKKGKKIRLTIQAEGLIALAVKEHDVRVEGGEEGQYILNESIGTNLTVQAVKARIRIIMLNMRRNKLKTGTQDVVKKVSSLCRGEQQNLVMNPVLKCHNQRRSNPWLSLAPLQSEQKHKDPDVWLFHDVISTVESEKIQHLSRNKLARSEVMKSMGGIGDISSIRTSRTGWIKGSDDRSVRRLNLRISLITGLDTKGTYTFADDDDWIQVAQYQAGEHYSPHYDYVETEDGGQNMIFLEHKNKFLGDWVATFMMYLSPVDEGGATVFPRLGLRVSPEVGSALFWYNLKSDGKGDERTLHAACPVLHGSKWVGNRWIREGGQVHRRPCSR